jgi:hypothetical protein
MVRSCLPFRNTPSELAIETVTLLPAGPLFMALPAFVLEPVPHAAAKTATILNTEIMNSLDITVLLKIV